VSRIRVFIASSLDGFIAGPNDEIDWLPDPEPGAVDTFTPFFAEIGAMLMGRRTYDVICGFESWPYGETPVLVATSRPLDSQRVRAVAGSIDELVAAAKLAAGERDVYLDGGALIRSALDAGLVDEITVTMIPIVLGAGIPLFAGAARQHRLETIGSRSIGGGLVELRYRVV
jgi:dihydrofolate reductase